MASVVGLGFVGTAIQRSFKEKHINPLVSYDKFKDGGSGSFEECLITPIMFLCLPTPYDEMQKCYDIESLCETIKILDHARYKGVIVIKSTVEPGTTSELSRKHPSLAIMHNPEFLSTATAFEDFHNQQHIVIGRGDNCTSAHVNLLQEFYGNYYSHAEVSICEAIESESMKCFLNCFYAVKIQFFNELYLSCQQNGSDFNIVRNLMLKNKWINPMHTSVPGRDGRLSYAGNCFPKDTNALLQYMKRSGTPHAILESCIKERNIMRGEIDRNTEYEKETSNEDKIEIDISGSSMQLIKTICGHKDIGHRINKNSCLPKLS